MPVLICNNVVRCYRYYAIILVMFSFVSFNLVLDYRSVSVVAVVLFRCV